ncbi:hypothetical protein SOV_37610 [Sporomusa ovata DSM 2662]|uniref:Uncharacterized protein n=1 Tax=Sporomusa ovata TaxID=2378 RepID=A0A0U1KTJ7_9FIRM|nr:hypothetical protein [Sporomusa ovata]EQB26150.1 hypothetical protein SOV_3c00240 [Sporomusa ovata DSM 2662]CQR70223.1 hypothetical protein SpAn4DRAFT_1192 [Sporomusa ovata]
MDLSLVTSLDFCALYLLVGLAGIFYGIKQQNRLVLLIAAGSSVAAGLIIIAGVILVKGIK